MKSLSNFVLLAVLLCGCEFKARVVSVPGGTNAPSPPTKASNAFDTSGKLRPFKETVQFRILTNSATNYQIEMRTPTSPEWGLCVTNEFPTAEHTQGIIDESLNRLRIRYEVGSMMLEAVSKK